MLSRSVQIRDPERGWFGLMGRRLQVLLSQWKKSVPKTRWRGGGGAPIISPRDLLLLSQWNHGVPQTGALLGLPGGESPVLGWIPSVTNEVFVNQVGEEGDQDK